MPGSSLGRWGSGICLAAQLLLQISDVIKGQDRGHIKVCCCRGNCGKGLIEGRILVSGGQTQPLISGRCQIPVDIIVGQQLGRLQQGQVSAQQRVLAQRAQASYRLPNPGRQPLQMGIRQRSSWAEIAGIMLAVSQHQGNRI
jgi:hypothetical protein